MAAQALARLAAILGLIWAGAARADEVVPAVAPGMLVAVADTAIDVVCTGAGRPTVVLLSGLGGNVLDWLYVQPALARHYRVCAIDRPGAGWSARTARPRSEANMAEEVHEALAGAGEAAPFVMVGHSFGGLLALHYARRYAGEVAGLVLVDSMHPEQFERFPAAGVQLSVDPLVVLGRTPAAAAMYGLPEPLHGLAMALAQQDKARVFVVREMRAFVDDAHEVRQAGLPRLPSRILVHGNGEWNEAYPDGRMERAWRAMQEDLAVAIGAPAPVAVAGAGHVIALDAPEAVVEAIETLIAALPR